MLTQTFVLSGLAAVAAAVAQPAVTQAPARRQNIDDLVGDAVDGVASDVGDIGDAIGTKAGDIIDGVVTGLGDLGSSLGGLVSEGIACATDVISVVSSLPVPENSELASSVLSAYGVNQFTDACIAEDIPESLSADYVAYESAFVSWHNEHHEAIESARDSCPELPERASQLFMPPCSTAAGLEVGGGGGGGAGGDGDGGEGVAPRVTGMLAAVAAVALGAGAILL